MRSENVGVDDDQRAGANDSCIFEGRAYGALYRSTDRGIDWTPLDSIPFPPSGILTKDSIVVAYNDDNWSVARSTDNGTHWELDTMGFYNLPQNIVPYFGDEQLLQVQDSILLAVFATGDSATNYSGGTVIFQSLFNRSGWSRKQFIPNQTLWSVVTNGTTLIGIAETEYGFQSQSETVISNDNGRTWNHDTAPMPTLVYRNISCVASIGSNVFAGSDRSDIPGGISGLFLSTDEGTSWRDSALLSVPTHYLTISGQNVIAGTDIGIAVSTDSGASWTWHARDQAITALANDGSNVFAISIYEIYHSTDAGLSWDSSAIISDDTRLAVQGNMVLAGSMRSTNNGITWSDDTIPDYNEISQFAICNGIELAAGSGLFISTDDGETWNLNVKDWGYYPTTHFACKGDNVLASMGGIDLSTNNGLDWSYGLDSGTYLQGNESSLFISGTDLLVGSAGGSQHGGVWICPLSEMIPPPNAVSQPQPVSDALFSYPNPFSERTEITFSSQTAGYADISIVNILGTPVAHLFSGELGAGNHSFAWDAHGMAPGSYWCIVRLCGRVERVALLRE